MRDFSEQHAGRFAAIRDSLRRLGTLYLESARLTAAEKLTLFLSTAVAFIIAMVFMTFAIAFGAATLFYFLEYVDMPHVAAAAILAGVFVLLALLVFLLRRALIVNPIARFVSRLIMDIGKDSSKV